MTTNLTTDLILDTINKTPGINSVDLILSIYKQTHPKEVGFVELHDMLDDLSRKGIIRRLVVTGTDWCKTFFFPNFSRFYFE